MATFPHALQKTIITMVLCMPPSSHLAPKTQEASQSPFVLPADQPIQIVCFPAFSFFKLVQHLLLLWSQASSNFFTLITDRLQSQRSIFSHIEQVRRELIFFSEDLHKKFKKCRVAETYTGLAYKPIIKLPSIGL